MPVPTSGSVNLNRLSAFVAVVETGSFTAAAEKLRLTKAMVSQHVQRLESELGVTLLVRTTRRVTPTESGALFHTECAQVLQHVEVAIARVGGKANAPAGTLRLTASGDYGAAVVVPAVCEFMKKWPDIKVDFVAADKVIDLVAGGFDLAIRTGWVREPNLRATLLGSFEQVRVASAAYLKKSGLPKQPADLESHDWIAFTVLRTPHTWTFTPNRGKPQTVRVSAPISTNSTDTLRAFLRQGAGISVLPDYMIDADVKAGRLIPILTQWRLPTAGVHAVYPNMRFTSAKVRAFVDSFRAYLSRKA
jgi:DNA-binding transcriptional LysR family regulator